jgi:uncharacterized protein YcbK (DUF882 family)
MNFIGRKSLFFGRYGLPSAIVGIVAAVLLLPEPAISIDERRLSFYHTHTAKRLDVVYARGGQYVGSGLEQIEAFLSDFRTGDRKTIDPELLDLMYDLRQELGGEGVFEVVSAYRSPKTNEMLRRRSSGVARNSQHTLGRAIDVRLQGVELERLRDEAIAFRRGGVGYYPESDFVHLDTGRVRRW